MLQAIRSRTWRSTTAPSSAGSASTATEYAGPFDLVVANPPYGARGAAITEDPVRAYREKQAYAYFLRRSLDLLAPNGLGVFLIPAGFLTGRGAKRSRPPREGPQAPPPVRRLPAAVRPVPRRQPGHRPALLPVPRRYLGRGRLPERRLHPRGPLLRAVPDHILGTEVGKDAGDDDQTKKPRWGYQVEGDFTRLPTWSSGPICERLRRPTTAARPAKRQAAGPGTARSPRSARPRRRASRPSSTRRALALAAAGRRLPRRGRLR